MKMSADEDLILTVIPIENQIDVKSAIDHVIYNSQSVLSVGILLNFDCIQSPLVLQSVRMCIAKVIVFRF